MDKLRIVSYNCRGIKSSLPVIHELCTDNDIVLLQETLLCSHNLHFINSIHSDFYAGDCTSVDSRTANVLLWAGHMVGFVLCGENHLAPLSP